MFVETMGIKETLSRTKYLKKVLSYFVCLNKLRMAKNNVIIKSFKT